MDSLFGLGRTEREDFDYEFEHERTEEGDSVPSASILVPIHSSNNGFQMMLKMGWQAGSGLGKEGRKGRVDPVPFIHKADKEGVGKVEETEEKHVESTRTRKALESEVLAAETEEQRAKREIAVSESERIKEEIKAVTRAFYCELCDKQYVKISEFEMHLSSYDHNHKQRFKDMQQATKMGSLPGVANNKRRREDAEKAREEKEFKRLQEAALTKERKVALPAAHPSDQNPPVQPISDSGSFVPPLAPVSVAIKKPEGKVAFGFGVKKTAQPIKFTFGKK
ncbi:UNVERIFIED_CONTAM: G patch domain-containing protein 8 [Siphonaria sp. JEL0065]|nr:G patch domain-containing protein 8 [Siphonaria sp. JEL0065]